MDYLVIPFQLFYFSVYPNQHNHIAIIHTMLPFPPPLLPQHASPSGSSCLQGKELSRDRNWSDVELSKLSSFMLFHKQKFINERVRKEARVFAVLSKYLKTRNVNQCRNYVHKLLNKFRDFDQVVLFFKESLKNFEENYQKQQPLLKKIAFPLKNTQNEESKQRKEEIQVYVKEEIVEDNIAMKPTDVSYSEQLQNKSKNIQNNFQQLFLKHQQIRGKDLSKHSHSGHSSILDESYFSSHYCSPTQQQQKWKDCHAKFVKWTSKTSHLLQKFRDRPPFPPPF